MAFLRLDTPPQISFPAVTAGLEDSPGYGVFFQIFIGTGLGAISGHESFGHLEHTGKRFLYAVKRIQH
jgi:hypothetical protein